jgi:putative CocE/NonD family hydrolase
VNVRLDVPVPVDGGVELAADVYLPDGGGPWPTALCRTPYDRQDERYVDWAVRFVAAGYAAVIEDCRGRYASGGEWVPYVNEQADGAATLRWLTEQDFCDGNVGMFGISYVGFVQSLAATNGLEQLKAVVPTASQEDNFGHMWTDGVLQLENLVNLGFYVGRRTMNASTARYLDLGRVYRTLPLSDALEGIVSTETYREFLQHPTFDEFWRAYSLKGRYGQIKAPALLITGWYDNLLLEQFKVLAGWRAGADSKVGRSASRIVVGPWSHFGLGERRCAQVDFGPSAARDLPGLHVDFYDRFLRDEVEEGPFPAPYEIFVMGENVWRSEDRWPPASVTPTKFFLHSEGAANSSAGDGRLGTDPPDRERADKYCYDPEDPVPTVGGPCMLEANTGPRDRSAVARRADVLCYDSDPLTVSLEVTGPVEAVIFAATSAVDTDFTATLVDLDEQGVARTICEGIVRARYRNSVEDPRPIVRNEVCAYRISLWSTSCVFATGHRVRLEISSSNFPRFDRNLNTGEAIASATRSQVASQTIYHDAEHPSHVVLPIRERPDLR